MTADEIRGWRIIVASFGDALPDTKAQWLVPSSPTGGPLLFLLSSVVVNRFPLHAGKEKTEVAPMRIRGLCQGDQGAFCGRFARSTFLTSPPTLARYGAPMGYQEGKESEAVPKFILHGRA